MIRAGGLLLAAILLPATAQPQDRAWWWNAPLKAFTMPSESMEPTIPPRSYIIARKRNPAEIQRGDLVVFQMGDNPWVKRVVGLPGDRIATIDGKVRLNGKLAEYGPGTPYPLPRAQTAMRRSERLPGVGADYTVLDTRHTPQDDVPEIVVPANHFYLLGDNRDNSIDSRFSLAEGGTEAVAFDQVYGVIDPANIARGKPAAPSAPTANAPEITPVERQ